MKQSVGLIVASAALWLSSSAFAETMFDGQLTPGTSNRADVERVLGVPLKQDGADIFEYTPPPGAAGVQVVYRPDGVVSAINVLFPQAYERANLVHGLNLSNDPQPTELLQEHLQEYFAAPAYVIFTYAAAQSASGVIRLRYDSAQTFAEDAPKGPVVASLPAPGNAGPAPAVPQAYATAPHDSIVDTLLPVSANRAYNFNLRLMTFMSTMSSRVGDTVRAQIISPVGAGGAAVDGGIAFGTIRAITCPLPGLNTCAIDFSLDTVFVGGRTIPIVCSLNSITNSRGVQHQDEEGLPIYQSSNYATFLSQTNDPAQGAAPGAHQDVVIEVSAPSPSVSLAPGSLFTAGINSDPSRSMQ